MLKTVLAIVISFLLVYNVRDFRLSNPNAITVAIVDDEEFGPDDTDPTERPVPVAEILLFESGEIHELADLLLLSGLNVNPAELEWAARILGITRFRQGRYLVEGSTGYSELLGRMLRGEEDPARIVIHAGQTYDRFYARASAQLRFTAEDLREVMTDTLFITEELGLEPHLLFGRMIPNTYEMFWTITPEQFVRRMLTEFNRAMAPLESAIEEHRFTLDQVLTMASIVELEAMFDFEKPTIAGLYMNRINRRMRLQADPTVNYALGRRGRLRVVDYRTQHPYNTYVINHLPPGPITNPAMSSIRAVLNPEQHNYLYMVATPEGTHRFTRTYAEHQREVAKWRQWLREQDRLRRLQEADG
ncbi:MAG: endolytic transglycosylase MltG [Balneolales bacterium]|nr:endolytic transglycosylase MltG [Balneolales bacterium]